MCLPFRMIVTKTGKDEAILLFEFIFHFQSLPKNTFSTILKALKFIALSDKLHKSTNMEVRSIAISNLSEAATFCYVTQHLHLWYPRSFKELLLLLPRCLFGNYHELAAWKWTVVQMILAS